jgi:hypothetical protein
MAARKLASAVRRICPITGLPFRHKPVLLPDGGVRNGQRINHGGASSGPKSRTGHGAASTPVGERRPTLSARTQGNTLKCSQMADGNSVEIFDVKKISGPRVEGQSHTEPLLARRPLASLQRFTLEQKGHHHSHQHT